jgi:hypothetical protein
MDGGGARSNGCAVGMWAPRVYGAWKPKFWCSGTQKWLKNGSETARATLEPVASAFPIGHPPSWEVPLVSDKEPRRLDPASARVPERPFPPGSTMRRAHAYARARAHAYAPGAGRQAGQISVCCKRYKKLPLTLKLSHTCARDGDLAIETVL